VFSEPKLVIPGTSVVESAEGSDSVEAKPSGGQLPEAMPAAVAQVSVAVETPVQVDGRQPKRARDIAGLIDSNATGGTRKKRKGNKKSG